MLDHLCQELRGGEGASVCVADVLGEVLSVRFLIWHDIHLAGSIVAVRVVRTYIDSALHAGARTNVHARNIRVYAAVWSCSSLHTAHLYTFHIWMRWFKDFA